MRIAMSGTHYMGKSTLISDFCKQHIEYQTIEEPYYLLQELQNVDLALIPSLDNLMDELNLSLEQLDENKNEQNIIFDRCPIDYLVYASVILNYDNIDILDSEWSDKFEDIKQSLNHLDIIIFLPISTQHLIDYPEDNPAYRLDSDQQFKLVYREDQFDIFPCFNHPRVIELIGDRATRVQQMNQLI